MVTCWRDNLFCSGLSVLYENKNMNIKWPKSTSFMEIFCGYFCPSLILVSQQDGFIQAASPQCVWYHLFVASAWHEVGQPAILLDVLLCIFFTCVISIQSTSSLSNRHADTVGGWLPGLPSPSGFGRHDWSNAAGTAPLTCTFTALDWPDLVILVAIIRFGRTLEAWEIPDMLNSCCTFAENVF